MDDTVRYFLLTLDSPKVQWLAAAIDADEAYSKYTQFMAARGEAEFITDREAFMVEELSLIE